MWHDPVVEEVRAIRDTYGKRFNYDLEAIGRDLRKKEAQSERQLVDPSPKRIEAAGFQGSG